MAYESQEPAVRGWYAPRVASAAPGVLAGLPGYAGLRSWLNRARHRQLLTDCRAQQQELQGLEAAAVLQGLGRVRDLSRRAWMRNDALAAAALLPDALAHLVLGAQHALQRPVSDQELLAAFALVQGCAVELGPPRSLAIAMAAVLASWSGLPCHVVVFHERRAEHDVRSMQPFYDFCAVSVACVLGSTPPESVGERYGADVVYATARRLLTDHSRDRRYFHGALSPLRQRLLRWTQAVLPGPTITRGLGVALIDDLDRVLIDDASQPLVLSETADNPLLSEAIAVAQSVIRELVPERDYSLAQDGAIAFTDAGLQILEELAVYFPEMWRREQRRDDLVMQALLVRDLLRRGQHYEVKEDQISFVESRAALAVRNKALLYGLVQAIEAHEGLPFSGIAHTVERASLQGYFQSYHRLGGAASSLAGVKRELWRTYGLMVLGQDRPGAAHPLQSHTVPARGEPERLAYLTGLLLQWQARGMPVLVCVRRQEDMVALVARLAANKVQVCAFDPLRRPEEAGLAEGAAVSLFGATPEAVVAPESWLVALPLARASAQQQAHALVLYEPLDALRAETDLLSRLDPARVAGRVLRFSSFDDALLLQQLPWLSPRIQRLVGGSQIQGLVLRWLHLWARMLAAAQGRHQRQLLNERERLLKQQLSFTADPATASNYNPPDSSGSTMAPR